MGGGGQLNQRSCCSQNHLELQYYHVPSSKEAKQLVLRVHTARVHTAWETYTLHCKILRQQIYFLHILWTQKVVDSTQMIFTFTILNSFSFPFPNDKVFLAYLHNSHPFLIHASTMRNTPEADKSHQVRDRKSPIVRIEKTTGIFHQNVFSSFTHLCGCEF